MSHLQPRDANLGRAFALGLLSHYVLDRNAHPFVYEQQFGIVESDPELEASGSQVHAVLESDLDVLMLQLKRDGATVEDYPPAGEIVTTDRINRVAGVLMSYVAGRVYGIDIPVGEYGGAVADMQLLYRTIEPAGSAKTRAIALLEGLVHDYSLLDGLAHRVTTELPERTGNLGHLAWKSPFTDEASTESFPEVFDRALLDYELTGRPLYRDRRYGSRDQPRQLQRSRARRRRRVRPRGVGLVRAPLPNPYRRLWTIGVR